MAIDEAREQTAEFLGCLPGEVIFVSGGTEAANLAIIGTCLAKRDGKRKRVLFGASEHHCVLHTQTILESLGFSIGLIPVLPDASVSADDLMIGDDVLLVSIMHANNETGAINDVETIAAKCAESGALFFSDCVQTFDSPPGCDLRSYSAHKRYGPKGAGALYVRAGVKPQPTSVGGGQERELRAGTENVAAIVGFAASLQLSINEDAIANIRSAFASCVTGLVPEAMLSASGKVLPGHAHFRVPGVSAEAALIVLDRLGISASSGAACSSGSIEPSHVLRATGLTEQESMEGLRFTFGKNNTMEDALYAAEKVAEAVAVVRA
jgi:cysteine desulfurase